jgi:hypothetical protein
MLGLPPIECGENDVVCPEGYGSNADESRCNGKGMDSFGERLLFICYIIVLFHRM